MIKIFKARLVVKKMKVSINEPKIVTLSEATIKEVSISYLKRLISPGEYLRNENGKIVLKQDDPNHYHGSISEHYVRDATELDLAVFTVLSRIEVRS